MKEALKEIGLSENEVKVYLALLELGESLASRVGEKIGMNRTQVYDIIESLIAKGLVSYVIRNNRKYFLSVSPLKIEDFLKQKERQIKQQEEKIKEIMPNLLNLQKNRQNRTNAEIYQGKEGIKTIYNDILKEAKEYYVLGGTGKISEELEFYYIHHEKARIKHEIKLKVLFNEKLKEKEITKDRKLFEGRFLPDDYSSPIPTLIYKNKVIILIWTEPLAIVIENKEVAETYKKYFELLWGIAER